MGKTCDHSSSFIYSSPEPNELIGWDSSQRPSLGPHFQTGISLRPVDHVIQFHQEHYWGGLVALCFGPDWMRTLVSIAIDSFLRVIMGKS